MLSAGLSSKNAVLFQAGRKIRLLDSIRYRTVLSTNTYLSKREPH
jgi:hypothetical protein